MAGLPDLPGDELCLTRVEHLCGCAHPLGRQSLLCDHSAPFASLRADLPVAVYFLTLVFLAITVVVVAKAPTYNDNKFVWATYTNEIGWSSSFVVVMTGLVNPSCELPPLPGPHSSETDLRHTQTCTPALMAPSTSSRKSSNLKRQSRSRSCRLWAWASSPGWLSRSP